MGLFCSLADNCSQCKKSEKNRYQAYGTGGRVGIVHIFSSPLGIHKATQITSFWVHCPRDYHKGYYSDGTGLPMIFQVLKSILTVIAMVLFKILLEFKTTTP